MDFEQRRAPRGCAGGDSWLTACGRTAVRPYAGPCRTSGAARRLNRGTKAVDFAVAFHAMTKPGGRTAVRPYEGPCATAMPAACPDAQAHWKL